MHPVPPPPRHAIRVPETCPQNRRNFTHCKLLQFVRPNACNGAGFEGPLLRPGARIASRELGEQPVLLEYAGPQGAWRSARAIDRRDDLWILWRYDWESREWREIARALARDASWSVVLRGPAILALRLPAVEAMDPIDRGREVTDQLVQRIDAALVEEAPAVRALVLTSIYDRMAGRIVAAA